MKLVYKIKLLPNKEQYKLLLDTIMVANDACNHISDIVWEQKIFQQFEIHKEVYHSIKSKFNLGSQVVIRCISKVSDAYKRTNIKVKRTFQPLGSICYDSRILTYKSEDMVSIWTINGRIKMPIACYNSNYIQYIKGESDLIFNKGKFYLYQTIEVPDTEIKNVEEFIGVDMGLVELAALSNGITFNAKKLTDYREKRNRVRSSLQSKCTKNAKRILKRLSGKEKRTTTIINHTISKKIVSIAKEEGKGVAIEDLKGITFSSKTKGKKFRTRLNRWSFSQLRRHLTYKCLLSGVKLIDVPPAYTSKTCSNCLHIGLRNKKTFTCKKCDSVLDADINAAKNIALLGMSINHPEKPSILFCKMQYTSGLKPL